MSEKPLYSRNVAAKMKRAGRCVNTNPALEHNALLEEAGTSRWDVYSDSVSLINQNKRRLTGDCRGVSS